MARRGSCSLFPPQAVINYKWRTFAQRLLVFCLAFYVVWLTAFTAFMILYTVSD